MWLYGMKTKDGMLKVIKKWYSDIADTLQKHDLVCYNERKCRRKQIA